MYVKVYVYVSARVYMCTSPFLSHTWHAVTSHYSLFHRELIYLTESEKK